MEDQGIGRKFIQKFEREKSQQLHVLQEIKKEIEDEDKTDVEKVIQ